ncbi:hypothetical protein BDV98DRAFT_638261 [Pterulicium gracile]|uniref:Uncharacterized protein n=1 Tax=Pterulicium gracile TaxID=1884261 RepID=A0A5C3Q2R1_9AGAR|nr:hypothetical protein BDV98DRAFT_638261 [Pterula gracilis]
MLSFRLVCSRSSSPGSCIPSQASLTLLALARRHSLPPLPAISQVFSPTYSLPIPLPNSPTPHTASRALVSPSKKLPRSSSFLSSSSTPSLYLLSTEWISRRSCRGLSNLGGAVSGGIIPEIG